MKINMRHVWLPVRVAIWLALLFVVYQAWVFIRPRPRALTVAEIGALDAACRTAVARLAAGSNTPTRVGVARFLRDDSGDAARLFQERIAAVPNWTVVEGSPIRRLLTDVARALREADTLDEVIHPGRRVGLDLIVAGRVVRTEASNSVGRAALQIYAFDYRGGGWKMRETITAEWRPSFGRRLADALSGLRPRNRLLLWLGVTLALPWLTMFGTRWALMKRNNAASFALVMGYIAVGLLLAFALAGFDPAALGPAKLLLILAVSAAYNYWACETIAGMK